MGILRKYSTSQRIPLRLSDLVIHQFFTRHQRHACCVRLLCRTGTRQAAMTHYRGESGQVRGFQRTLPRSLTQNRGGKRTMCRLVRKEVLGGNRERGQRSPARVSHREARSHPATSVGSRPFDRLRGLSGAHEVTVPGWSTRGGGGIVRRDAFARQAADSQRCWSDR